MSSRGPKAPAQRVRGMADPYPASLWAGAAQYFESLGDPDRALHGGRYLRTGARVARLAVFVRAVVAAGVSRGPAGNFAENDAWPHQRRSDSLSPLSVHGQGALC